MATAMVVYDAWYGCTQAVAEEVARGLSADGRVATVVANVKTIDARQVLRHDVLVFGTPNHRGAPTPPMRRLLQSLGDADLRRRRFAFFETNWGLARGRAVGRMEQVLRDRNPFGFPSFMSLSVALQGPRGPIRPGELSQCYALGRSIRTGLAIPA